MTVVPVRVMEVGVVLRQCVKEVSCAKLCMYMHLDYLQIIQA